MIKLLTLLIFSM